MRDGAAVGLTCVLTGDRAVFDRFASFFNLPEGDDAGEDDEDEDGRR